MKIGRIMGFFTLALILTVSCKRQTFIEGEWFGTITRISDGKEISKAVLSFEGKDLKISANALYAPSVNRLRFTEYKGGVYFYENDSSKLNLQFTLRNDTLFADGHNLKVEAVKDSVMSPSFLASYKERTVPTDIDSYVLGYWTGSIYRTSDDKPLSQIAMSSSLDSLQIYSNAISGKENVSWILSAYNPSSGAFEYKSLNLSWKMLNRREDVLLEGDGCYALLSPSAELDKTFFKNKAAPVNPNMYLAGNKYSGEMVPTDSYAIVSSFGKVYGEIEIIDDENLCMKLTMRITNSDIALLGMFAGEQPDKVKRINSKYIIANNTLIFDNGKEKYEIRDNGNALYQKTEKIGYIELKKDAVISGIDKKRELNYVICQYCGGTGEQMKFSTARQRREMGACSYCNGTGKRVTYE